MVAAHNKELIVGQAIGFQELPWPVWTLLGVARCWGVLYIGETLIALIVSHATTSEYDGQGKGCIISRNGL